MTYWRLALAVSLSAFALAVCAGAVARAWLGPLAARRLGTFAARRRAAALLALRMLPAGAALVVAFGLVLPTFVYFEPADTQERLSVTLLVAAAGGGFLMLRGLLAGVRAWTATRRVERRWAAASVPVHDLDAPLPVFGIPDPFPTVAIVGVVRPRLYIARRVLDEFPPEELRVMLAHEAAHAGSRDNLKRLLIRLAPDVRPREAAGLERAWAMAAEEAADARAAAGSPERRLDLAHALLRVARMAPLAPAIPPISTFYLGGAIDCRVRLLLDPPDVPAEPSRGWIAAAGLAAGTLAAFVVAAPWLHQLMEATVRWLP